MLKRITATTAIAACLTVIPATAAHAAENRNIVHVNAGPLTLHTTIDDAIRRVGPELCGVTSGEFASDLGKDGQVICFTTIGGEPVTAVFTT
jgi:hypothetical protein